MTRNHELKTWTEYFQRLGTNGKSFEIRKNDRDFQVNDSVTLCEYDQHKNEYLNNYKTATITYILHGGSFGIEFGYCVLQLKFDED